LIVALAITPIDLTSCNRVGIASRLEAAASPLLAAIVVAILSAPQIIEAPLIVFVVFAAWAEFPHAVCAISPAVGGRHQFGDGL
jgi:ABC-type Na+ efflux pump permease subunit